MRSFGGRLLGYTVMSDRRIVLIVSITVSAAVLGQEESSEPRPRCEWNPFTLECVPTLRPRRLRRLGLSRQSLTRTAISTPRRSPGSVPTPDGYKHAQTHGYKHAQAHGHKHAQAHGYKHAQAHGYKHTEAHGHKHTKAHGHKHAEAHGRRGTWTPTPTPSSRGWLTASSDDD